MSPSYDGYLHRKYGKDNFLISPQRLELCKEGAKDINWLNVDDFECNAGRFIDHDELQKYYEQKLQSEVFYICGEDLFNNCCKYHDTGTIIKIKRSKTSISSTEIRNLRHNSSITSEDKYEKLVMYLTKPVANMYINMTCKDPLYKKSINRP